MANVFLSWLDMSIAASFLIVAVIVLRLALKKAPKNVNCILWVLVGIRLVCPIAVESPLSLIPSAQPVQQILAVDEAKLSAGGVPAQSIVLHHDRAEVSAPWGNAPFYFAIAWIAGMAVMMIYALGSYYSIKKKVDESVLFADCVYLCDRINSPFLLGITRPRIFLPSDIREGQISYVVAHERAHLARRDHWWKALGFLILSAHWFNPLVWVSYMLFCKDIELACDEKVISDFGIAQKKAYSTTLLECSIANHRFSAHPLAFGEVSVKERVKVIMSYKKPAYWTILIAVLACAVMTLCFLTNPQPAQAVVADSPQAPVETQNAVKESASPKPQEDAHNQIDALARFCSIPWDEIESRNLSVGDDVSMDDIICIGEMEEQQIKIYGYNDQEVQGRGVAIRIKDNVNYFDWQYISTRGLLPSVYWNDGSKQLQMSLKTYAGSGLAAEELHVLNQYGTGTLSDVAFTLDDYSALLSEKIGFSFDSMKKILRIVSLDDGSVLAEVAIPNNGIDRLELGRMSEFVLGDRMALRVQVGYVAMGQVSAQYENMPVLEFPVQVVQADDQMVFGLGEAKVHNP